MSGPVPDETAEVDSCLDRQAVDGFEIEFDAEILLALLEDLGSERLVGDRHII